MKTPFQRIAGLIAGVTALLAPHSVAFAATIDVSSLDGSGMLTPVLDSGKTYLFEVTGTYEYGHGDWADAEFLSYFGAGPLEQHGGFSVDVLDLTINGQSVDWLGGANWQPHTYSPDHVYRYYVAGGGAAALLTIADWHPLIPNDEHRGDNSGSLRVTISAVPDGGSTAVLAALSMLSLLVFRRNRR